MSNFKIESGIQLLARLTKKPEIEDFYPQLFDSGVKRGDIIEIYSDISTSILLNDMVSEVLLQNRQNELKIGVLILDTVGQFNFNDFIEILKEKISHLIQNESTIFYNIGKESVLNDCLANIFILEIYDATQFYVTIQNLDSILMTHPNISMVIFNSLTAFYWAEQGFKITKMDLYIKNLLRMIRKLCRECNIVCIYTRPGYFSSCKSSENLETCEVLNNENVNFKIQLVPNNSKGAYEVNIQTLDSYSKKYFNITNKQIKWQ